MIRDSVRDTAVRLTADVCYRGLLAVGTASR